MPRQLVLRIASVVVLVGLAIGGYLLWIPLQRPNPGKLAALAVTNPVKNLRPHPQGHVVATATSPLQEVRTAAASTPGDTGTYAAGWKGTKPVKTGSFELNVLPNRTSARSALAEAKSVELASTALTAVGYGFGGTTRVSAIAGAKGAYYLKGTKPEITASTQRATVIVFGVGRVVVDVTVDATGAAATTAARDLAIAEHRHLERVGADPALAETQLPVVASVVYALVALAVVALAVAAPTLVTTVQRRRREAHEAAARRARVARGKKVVKRHASRGFAGRVQAKTHGRR